VAWTGHVRDRQGQVVPGPGQLLLTPPGTGRPLEQAFAEDGSFRLEVAPGRYRVHVGRGPAPGPVDVGEFDLVNDLELDLHLP
jgi:hypothetical protein